MLSQCSRWTSLGGLSVSRPLLAGRCWPTSRWLVLRCFAFPWPASCWMPCTWTTLAAAAAFSSVVVLRRLRRRFRFRFLFRRSLPRASSKKAANMFGGQKRAAESAAASLRPKGLVEALVKKNLCGERTAEKKIKKKKLPLKQFPI